MKLRGKVILENADAMVRLAEALLIKETLDGVQIRRLVAGLPFDDDGSSSSDDDNGTNQKKKRRAIRLLKNPFFRRLPEIIRQQRKKG